MRTLASPLRTAPAAAALLHAATALAVPAPPPVATVAGPEEAPYSDRVLAARVEHAERAGRIGRLCAARTRREPLRAFCARLAVTLGREAEQARALLGEQGRDLGTSPEGQARLEQLSALPAERLDVEVLRELLDLLVAAAQRSALCLSRAPRPLAAQCASSLEARVEAAGQLRAWLCDWHGVCSSAAAPAATGQRPWQPIARRD